MKTLRQLIPFALAAGSSMATTIVDVDFAHLAPLVGDPAGLDDGDRIQDVSGNGYHGFWGSTNSNVPVVAVGSDTAIDTTGTAYGKVFLRDALGSIPDEWDGPTTTVTPYFTFDGTQSYTFEAVVNWNSTTQALNGLMGQTGGNELWIRESGGFLHYAFVSNGANANLFTNVIDISSAKADGGWHVVSVVYDATAGEIRSYLDGTLKHTNTDSDIGALGTMVNGTSDFSIGAYNASSSNYFDGLQNRYRISTGALDPVDFLTAPVIAGSDAITWTGGTDGSWDATTSGNWKLDADDSPVLFSDTDDVTFDDDGATGSIAIVGTVAPGMITVSSNSVDYTLSGGTLGGSGTLVKSGTSTFTLAGPATRVGAVQIDSGTLVIGDGATSGDAPSGAVAVAEFASLKISRSDTVNYSATSQLKQIGGDGSVTIDGGGTVIVNPGTGTGFDENSSWRDLTGGVTVTGGSELQTLRNGRTAMGSGAVTLGDGSSSGALSQYNGSWTWTNDIVLAGSANAIRNRSSNSFPRQIKLQGVISGSGGLVFEDPNGSMTDNQTGYILTGESTTDGTITIDSGVPVRVGGVPGDTSVVQNGPGAAGSLGTATIIDNGFLTYSRTDAHTVANTISGAGQLLIGLDSGTETQVVNLTGTVSNTGDTTVRSGTLLINGTHGSQVFETLSQLNVGPAAALGGTGQTTSDVNLEGTLAPGNSIGTLTTTSWLVLMGSSTYTWELGTWSGGVAGTDSDLVAADEIHIDSSAAPGTPVTLAIVPAALSGFTESNQTFVIAQATTGIVDFNTDAFVIDDSAFTSATGANGSWAVQQNGNHLELVYTAGAASDYDTWAGPTGFDLTGGPDDDDDNDGLSNHDEYAFGLKPNDGSSVNPITVPLDRTTGTFTYIRRDDALTGLSHSVWTSGDLVNWTEDTTATLDDSAGPDGNGAEPVAVTLSGAKPLGATTLFVRVKAD